jgi:hypothetical protein
MGNTGMVGWWVTTATKAVPVREDINVDLSTSSSVDNWLSNITANLVQTPGTLNFTLRNTDADNELVFTPHYQRYTDRYGIYFALGPISAFVQNKAVSYDTQSGGIVPESCSEGGQDIGCIQNGSYLVFKNVYFGGGAVSFDARVASAAGGGNIELYLDSLTGTQVGTCAVTNTGGWQTWVTKSCPVSGATGRHDLYLKFTGGSGYLFNVNWWKFNCTASQDIGAVGAAGNAGYSNGVFTVTGAGADIGSTADAFRFVNVAATGDCTIIARVSSLENINPSSKAGVMIRQSLAANAANAFVAVTPGNGVTWQYRSSTGGSTNANNTTGPNAPYWVKLVRSGNAFTGYCSPDGTNWTQIGSTTITMGSAVYVGLAVTSHTVSTLCTATFDNMTAPNWPTSAAPSGLVTTAVSTTQINLSWNACTNATGYNIKRSTTSGGPYTTIAAGVTTTNFDDTDVVADTTYYYVVSAWVGGSETPNSAQVTAILRTPRAYLKFDETSGTTASDSTGNGWNGTLVNGPLWVTGKYDKALAFDSLDDYVSLPAGVVDGLTDFTISTWVYLNTTGTWSRIFDFGTGTSVNMFLTPISGSGKVRFAITTNGSGSEQQINGSAALPSEIWTHVAVTLSGSTGILYVNGAEVARNSSMSLTPNSLGATTQNYIGKSQYGDPYLSGLVDDFRIYANALSATEVAMLAAPFSNTAPYFTANPIHFMNAIELSLYSGTSLASYANDIDGMSTVTFSKVSGPEWLTVVSNGALLGFPHNANVGANAFTVQVTDNGGLSDTATMNITVANIYSGTEGINDLLGLAAQWLSSGCTDTPACDGADLDGDGDADVDLDDFAVLAFNWTTDESLQLDLKLDETSGTTAADSSMYSRPGTLNNGPVWSAGHTTGSGALSFDGTDDSVVITGYKGITGTSSRTCSAWIKTATTGAVMSWGRSVPTGGDYWYCLVNYSASGNPGALHVSVMGGNVVGTTDLRDGQWHHIAVVFDSDSDPDTSDLTLYVDGLAESVSYLGLRAINTVAETDVYLGSRLGGASYLFSGLMDDVRIYSRALTVSEIAAMMQ